MPRRCSDRTADPPRPLVECRRRNVGMVNVEWLARALAVDLPTLMAGLETERRR